MLAIPCPHASLSLCAGRCVEVATDPEHCGACGHACGGAEGPVCAGGECVERCADGLSDCGGACVDLSSSVLHCAACGHPCSLFGAESACEDGTCALTACRPGFVDLDGRGSNGCECVVSRGGQEVCDEADNDCDGATDDGFLLDEDLANCGACGHACVPDNGAVECRAGECVVLRCDAGFFDLNIDGADGCEYGCTPAVPPREECNEADDDCDGVTDEDFDLQADVGNCGRCGHACDLFGAEAECIGGACAVAACLDGFFDVDGEPQSGCEVVHEEGGTLYVDDDAPGPGAGTPEAPFPTIQAALEVAQEGAVVEVAAGFYRGPVVVGADFVTVRGAGRDDSELQGDGEVPAATVSGDHARFEGFTVNADHAPTGVLLDCDEGCALVDCLVAAVQGRDGVEGEVAGVVVDGCEGALIEDNEVSEVAGGRGPGAGQDSGAPGAAASGILLRDASRAAVSGNTVLDVRGGTAGTAPENRIGGSGGFGAAIHLASSWGCAIAANNALTLSGGQGADRMVGLFYGTPGGGDGGSAAGVRLSASAGNTLSGNTFANVAGAEGGWAIREGRRTELQGTAGAGYGVWLGPESLDNVIEDTNTLDGDPVVYLHGAEGVVVEGYRLTAPSNPTNLGKIVLIGCQNATVRGNEVRSFRAGGGASARSAGHGSPGLEATGILVRDSRAVTVLDNVVSAIAGGQGGLGYGDGFVGGNGGAAAALRLERSAGATLSGNAIHGIEGGEPGLLRDWHGSGPYSYPGPAYGILVISSENVHSANDLVFDASGDAARGFQLQGETPGATITNATVHGARGDSDGTGIRVESGAGAVVKNTIVASCSHHGIWNHPGNAALDLRVSYSDAWGNPAGDLVNVRQGLEVIAADPLFEGDDLAAPADFALDDGSPAIDAGDPGSACDAEPPPPGGGDCRIDLGHLGNTAGARVR